VRGRARFFLAPIITAVMTAVAVPPAAERGAALLDAGADVRIDRAFVPSADRRQGEVRIIRRGPHVVVQTLLYSKVIKRVVGAIVDKERAGWPEKSEGHADMERYVAALQEAQRQIPKPEAAPGTEGDRRAKLLIEFIDDPAHPIVALGGVEIGEESGEVSIRQRRSPMVLEPSPGYVRRNMTLIVADAFHLSTAEAEARLAAAARR